MDSMELALIEKAITEQFILYFCTEKKVFLVFFFFYFYTAVSMEKHLSNKQVRDYYLHFKNFPNK